MTYRNDNGTYICLPIVSVQGTEPPARDRIVGYRTLTHCPYCGDTHDSKASDDHLASCFNCQRTFIDSIPILAPPETYTRDTVRQCIICGDSYTLTSDNWEQKACSKRECIRQHSMNQAQKRREWLKQHEPPKPNTLSDIQRIVYTYIRDSILNDDYIPRVPEIQAAHHIDNHKRVRNAIRAVVEKGYLVRDGKGMAGLRLPKNPPM